MLVEILREGESLMSVIQYQILWVRLNVAFIFENETQRLDCSNICQFYFCSITESGMRYFL